MSYFVIYDRGKGLQVFRHDDYNITMQFAAQEKVKGTALVEVAQSLLGELVLTAEIVSPDAASGQPRRAPKRHSSKKGSKRSQAQIKKLKIRMLSYIGTNPGHRIDQMSTALGVITKDLVLPMRRLVANKEVKKRGKARATSYFPNEVKPS